MDETLTLEFDGGSRGNPGPAGIGAVVRAADGTALVTLGRFIGRATNNVAEYRALITAMQEAKKLGASKILIRGDSELIIRQMTGVYKVKHPDMRKLYDEAQHLLAQFERSKIEHNLRHKNELADKLANLAMDRRADVTDVDNAGPARASTLSSAVAATRPTAPSPTAQSNSAKVSTSDSTKRFSCSSCGCVIEVVKPSTFDASRLREFSCACGKAMNIEGARILRQL